MRQFKLNHNFKAIKSYLMPIKNNKMFFLMGSILFICIRPNNELTGNLSRYYNKLARTVRQLFLHWLIL